MKIKSVTIETDKGAEVTMSFDEVDDFFNAMRRLKKSAAGPKDEYKEQTAPLMMTPEQLLAIEQLKLEVQRQQGQLSRNIAGPLITTTGGTSTFF